MTPPTSEARIAEIEARAEKHIAQLDAFQWEGAADLDPRNLIVDLLSELRAANTAVERMREQLEWYGENARLCRLIHSEGDAGRHALADDGGKRARTALEETK